MTQKAGKFDNQFRQATNGIWWLASYPKSGSTWVRMWINAAVTRFPADINASFQYATGDTMFPMYQSTSVKPVSHFDYADVVYRRPAALMNKLAEQSRDQCLKTHHANVALDEISMCPPKISKGAVYIVRDPRDVCVSFAKHIGVTIDEAIDTMTSEDTVLSSVDSPLFHYVSSWPTHVESWLDEDNPIPTTCVRYEDMLAEPDVAFGKIVHGLGLTEWVTDEHMKFAFEQTQFDKLRQQERDHGFKETGGKQEFFFNKGKAGTWRDVLTDAHVDRIVSCCHDVMVELGYDVDRRSANGTQYEHCENARQSCA